jgi:8-oxo-dGTP diphosphatase
MQQFGTKQPGRDYVDRPTALGIALNTAGLLLVARAPRGLVLPGGGVDAGETFEQAVVREFLEETGYEVAVVERLGAARQFEANSLEAYNKECHFFRVRIVAKRGAPIEPDHEPMWVDAKEAERSLKEHASRWAVAQWGHLPH